MKPISLKIKGINSYVSEQSINFEKLTRTNLFGVFGETGSGKSTILDSIIMALYGTSERDVIQNTINVNVKDAHIVYEFEIKEDDRKYRYLIRRDYKLRPSGLKTTAYLKDVFGDQVLCEGSDNVTEKVTEIIGVAISTGPATDKVAVFFISVFVSPYNTSINRFVALSYFAITIFAVVCWGIAM